jgi:heterotetrameric sarcosine oxidase gamma subunit
VPEVRETTAPASPVARSPIVQTEPVSMHLGWEVSRVSCDAALRLADLTPLSKFLVRAAPDSAAAQLLDCAFGSARHGNAGELIIGAGPDEWLVLGPVGTRPPVVAQLVSTPGLVTVLEVTHGRVVLRLTGEASAETLEKLCAIDLAEGTTPDGAAFRTSVARVNSLVIRNDVDGVRSYLICSDRSSGQYLFDVLRDAAAEFFLAVEGFPDKGV